MRVLSFGAGVQSSALLLMSENGVVPPVDFAIFADTQAEPEEVNSWLKKIRLIAKTPIHVATYGNIEHMTIEHWQGRKKWSSGQPPFYTRHPDGKGGMLMRHCTREFKVRVVDREIRKQLGIGPRGKIKTKITLLMGISYDEMERMRISTQAWKTNEYPLVDLELRRQDCIDYVEKFGIGKPPRSACFFCPYKSDAEWRRLRDEHPADWKRAVEFDSKIRRANNERMTNEFFVHRSRVPLDQADISKDERQMTMLDECEGMCGV